MNLLSKKYSLPTALFHRTYKNYTGGHGKVWDYFNHIRQSGLYQTQIYFSPDSVFDSNNPWKRETDSIVPVWKPDEADLLFLAGMDWEAIPANLSKNIPIINLIQGIRHADSNLPLYDFLQKRALRICVSQGVADAILATGQVNGPVSVIPNSIGNLKPIDVKERSQAIFIGALKNKSFGEKLAKQLLLSGYQINLLTKSIPKKDFLQKMGQARLAILLPAPVEGFFLPGLEAMALGTPVIMPDCIGNREYAITGKNCLLASPKNIVKMVEYFDDDAVLDRIRQAGIETSENFRSSKEREKFLDVLNNIRKHWLDWNN